MRFKIYLSCLLMGLLILTGCTPRFDSAGYVTSMMDALYKGDYTAYADFTGITTSEVSQYRDQWLNNAADNFITMTGAGSPSEEIRDRTKELFKKIYANARYEIITDEETAAVRIAIAPMNLLVDNYENIQNFVDDFNARNDTYAFASLTDQEFYDTYLDGILTILESHLSGLTYGEAVPIEITISQDEDGLYTISPETLADIQATVLKWP